MWKEEKALIKIVRDHGPISPSDLTVELAKQKMLGFGVEVLDIVGACSPHVIYDKDADLVKLAVALL